MTMINRLIVSLGILAVALGVAYIPLPQEQRTVIVVSGTELQEPLENLASRFEQIHPNIDLELKFQGSRDIINDYVDDNNIFTPTILIPANGELLNELRDRWHAQNTVGAFYGTPQPIAKTMLVGIAWPERGQMLFPSGRFQWNRVEEAINAGVWENLGSTDNWGSFDLVITDPTRSNSGQLALTLWSQAKLNSRSLSSAQLGSPDIQDLFSLVKRSIYLPPRSTDILLQEFITRGPNDTDVALVYESIALYRWEQSTGTQNSPYQIYYLDPTIETVSTAVITTRGVDKITAEIAQEFLDFLTQPEQQTVFVQFGFRPIGGSLDLRAVPDSPWAQRIPGAEVVPPSTVSTTPDQQTLSEIIRLWQRAN